VQELAFALVLLCVVIALTGWRNGMFACVVVALLQDPLRKLAPNAPVYYVVLVGVVFAASWLGAVAAGVRLRPSAIAGTSRLTLAFTLVCAVVAAQAVHAYVRWENLTMVGIGLLAYLAPLPAVVLAYQFAARSGLATTKSLLLFYLCCTVVFASGIAIEFYGGSHRVLGEVGVGQFVYDAGVSVTRLPSGFFRSAETAAWHVVTCACLLFILFRGRKLSVPVTLVVIAAALLLMSLGVMTGRRKILVQLAVFAIAIYGLQLWFVRGKEKWAWVAIVAGALAFVSVGTTLVAQDEADIARKAQERSSSSSRYDGFKARGASVWEEIPQRASKLGIEPIGWAINRWGIFGAGLGSGSQGTQYFGGGSKVFGGASEGGLGKITQELGLPGLILLLYFFVMLFRHIVKILVVASRHSTEHAQFAYGCAALLVANVAAFFVATQVFGDLFVLLFLGWILGFLLAIPIMIDRDSQVAQPVSRQNVSLNQFRATPNLRRLG
jgi:hypothetical protein